MELAVGELLLWRDDRKLFGIAVGVQTEMFFKRLHFSRSLASTSAARLSSDLRFLGVASSDSKVMP